MQYKEPKRERERERERDIYIERERNKRDQKIVKNLYIEKKKSIDRWRTRDTWTKIFKTKRKKVRHICPIYKYQAKNKL